jgi:hypothetical protein
MTSTHVLRPSPSGQVRQLAYYASFLVERCFSVSGDVLPFPEVPGLGIDLHTVPDAIPEFNDLRLIISFPLVPTNTSAYVPGSPSLILTSYGEIDNAHSGADKDAVISHRSQVIKSIRRRRVKTMHDSHLEPWQDLFRKRSIDIYRSIKGQFREGMCSHLKRIGYRRDPQDVQVPDGFPFDGVGVGDSVNRFNLVTQSLMGRDLRLWLGPSPDSFHKKFRQWLFLGHTRDAPAQSMEDLRCWASLYWNNQSVRIDYNPGTP